MNAKQFLIRTIAAAFIFLFVCFVALFGFQDKEQAQSRSKY